MTSQVTPDRTARSDDWNRAEIRASQIRASRTGAWRLFFAWLLILLPACQPAKDLASERHAKAVKALIDLGAEVRDVEDEVSHDHGTYVFLYAEHFNREGQMHDNVLTLIREIQTLFLDLSDTPLKDEALPKLARLPNLQVLNLTRTQMTDRGLKLIAASRDIRLLKLNRTRITDEGLAGLADMPSLRMIYLGNTSLSDAALGHLAKLPQLEAIKLSGLPISDEGLKSLQEMPRLRFLGLDGSSITDAGLKHLELLPKLAYLDVQETAVSQQGAEGFRKRHPQCHLED
ncbi:MAG: leucine-rich repeat domain-containing protein [Planctomycetaceae bacterium]